MQAETGFQADTRLSFGIKGASPITLGRSSLRSKRLNIEKALISIVAQTRLPQCSDLVLFLGHRESIDIEFVKSLPSLDSIKILPFDIDLFWQCIVSESSNSVAIVLLGEQAEGESNKTDAGQVGWLDVFPDLRKGVKTSILACLAAFRKRPQSKVLLEIKAGRFMIDDLVSSSLTLSEEACRDENFSFLDKLILSSGQDLMGWCLGGVALSHDLGRGSHKLQVKSMVLDHSSDLDALEKLAEDVMNFISSVGVNPAEIWISSRSPLRSMLLARQLVEEKGQTWLRIFFPDFIFGMNMVATSHLFLDSRTLPRLMVCLESNRNVRFVMISA